VLEQTGLMNFNKLWKQSELKPLLWPENLKYRTWKKPKTPADLLYLNGNLVLENIVS